MNIINTSKITKVSALSALVIAFAALTVAAPQAFAWGRTYAPTYYGNYVAPVTVSTPIYPTAPIAYYPTPSYQPTYYPTNTYSQIGGSCYAETTSANVGQSVTWIVDAYGGNGNNYSYSWSGTGGLYGYGPTISYAYETSGSMVANVTISSGSQSESIPCNNDVIVTGYAYNYNNGYVPPTYNYGNYYNNNQSLAATCNANTTSAAVGQPVTWSANVQGGDNYYTYTWSGSNNLYGSGQSITATYGTPGQQYGEVTVYSNGQSVTAQCANSVSIGNGANYSNSGNGNSLTIGCAADSANVRIGTPVTWSAEVTGGSGQYTYAWSGTDGLAGSQSSVATTYESAGTKQAVVIVTSSDGMTGSKACTTVTVLGNGGGSYAPRPAAPTPAAPSVGNNSGISAASLFSLANIPWGWVAVLIILVLFGTIMYLLFNKNKI